MEIATKKLMNHAVWHLSQTQANVRTAADWNDLESAKHILRELRDGREPYSHSKAMQVVEWAFPERRAKDIEQCAFCLADIRDCTCRM